MYIHHVKISSLNMLTCAKLSSYNHTLYVCIMVQYMSICGRTYNGYAYNMHPILVRKLIMYIVPVRASAWTNEHTIRME